MMKKVVVLACMLSLLVPAAVLVGCGSGSSAQTPGQVAQAFLVAVKKKDANSSWNSMSADSQKALKTETAWESYLKQSQSSSINLTVGKATINGNKATVKVTDTVNGQTSTENIPLVKENGVWKVEITGTSTQ